MKKWCYYLGFGMACINVANAELQVIADLGGESAVRFYEPIQPVHSDNAPKHPNAVPQSIPEAQMLPVVSHKWRVGTVVPQKLELLGAMPLFLVGVDDVSKDWLQQNRDKLIELNATGLVINVNTEAELADIRQIIPELTLMPSPADALSDRLGINFYPVIITSEGISQ